MRSPTAGAIRTGLLILCSLALPSYAAEVRITLPLEGYYRPGKYMPVRAEVRSAPVEARLRLSGDGAVPTDIATLGGALSCVAPLLPMEDGPWRVRWSLGEDGGVVAESSMRALEPGQRLIGFTSSIDPELGAGLFPGSAVIPIRVEPAELALGEAITWNTLDALVFESDVLRQSNIGSFIAAGVAVAIRSDAAPFPDSNWPWERVGAYWVLRSECLGPVHRAAALPSVFAPLHGRHAGFPRALRYLVVLLAVVAAVLILAAAMIRKRWAAGLVVLASIFATGALHHAWKRTSPLVTRLGAITVERDGILQYDTWSYHAAARSLSIDSDAQEGTMPFFERDRDWRETGLRLDCDSNGHPILFHYELSPARRIAFLRRVVRQASGDNRLPSDEDSPMWRLAQTSYLRPGYRVFGTWPASGTPPTDLMTEHFPTVVITRQRTRDAGVSEGAGSRD